MQYLVESNLAATNKKNNSQKKSFDYFKNQQLCRYKRGKRILSNLTVSHCQVAFDKTFLVVQIKPQK